MKITSSVNNRLYSECLQNTPISVSGSKDVKKLFLDAISNAKLVLGSKYDELLTELCFRVETEEVPEISFVSKRVEYVISIIRYDFPITESGSGKPGEGMEGISSGISSGVGVSDNFELLYVLEVMMPCRSSHFKCPRSAYQKCDCALIWMPWPKCVPFPESEGRTGGYHDIKLFNKMLTQPR